MPSEYEEPDEEDEDHAPPEFRSAQRLARAAVNASVCRQPPGATSKVEGERHRQPDATDRCSPNSGQCGVQPPTCRKTLGWRRTPLRQLTEESRERNSCGNHPDQGPGGAAFDPDLPLTRDRTVGNSHIAAGPARNLRASGRLRPPGNCRASPAGNRSQQIADGRRIEATGGRANVADPPINRPADGRRRISSHSGASCTREMVTSARPYSGERAGTPALCRTCSAMPSTCTNVAVLPSEIALPRAAAGS